MTAVRAQAGAPILGALAAGPSMFWGLLRYAALIVVDALALLLIYSLASDGEWALTVAVALTTLVVNVINLRPDLYPLRWMSPAFALIGLLVIYPIFFTVYVAFTNYGDGHLLTKIQAIERHQQELYLPEGAEAYAAWHPYQNESGDFALLLRDAAGNFFFALYDELIPWDGDPDPESFEGYNRLRSALPVLSQIEQIQNTRPFGDLDNPIGISTRSGRAVPFYSLYNYDSALDALINNQTGVHYYAITSVEQLAWEACDGRNKQGLLGEFVAAETCTTSGITGFWVPVGARNFEAFITSPALGGPLLRIFMWTVAFALLSVISTFTMGLFLALVFNAGVPTSRLFRSILIIPYAIPGLIAVGIWQGMLNENFGVITQSINSIFGPGTAPKFISDPGWAKFGILLVNLWLGYPYFLLVCSGALAAIPRDMYEAARVDGASAWQQFTGLTLPMLLVAIGPLLIASFTFNFNNFVIIEAYNKGGPPMVESGIYPAGHTDILISYTFRLAFGGGRGADYGLASAITIIIFLMVATVTLLQFRFTRGWEETSENV